LGKAYTYLRMDAVGIVFLALFGICCCLCLFCQFLFFRRTQKAPPNRPDEYLKTHSLRGENAKKVVYLLGDSHFHGRFGFDVVRVLNGLGMEKSTGYNPEGESAVEDRFIEEANISSSYEIVNDGLNGRTAKEGLKRIPKLVACKPSAVVILLGTNDLFRQTSDSRREKASSEIVENTEKIIDAILWGVPSCRLAIVSIPIIGEQVETSINQCVATTNIRLNALCEKKSCSFLPLNTFQIATISARMEMKHMGDGEIGAPLLRPRNPSTALVLSSAMALVMLHKTCAEVSVNNGLTVTTDCIHLNDIAGAHLALLIARFLRAVPV